ncbi:MAG: type II toxin-antitoxin system VapC family toxin [Candidatus Eremiobacteraeota bacterium]|nr:type II toxin-antitoxin system VapC family toxin [Candidatus Eremiobacteraeota bacterium]
MRVLLDTRAFLWIAGDWKRVRPAARRVLANAQTLLFLSAASIWELSIKAAIGRLELPAEPPVYVPRRISDFQIAIVDVTRDHALAVYALPAHHSDPFDRMIVAQAQLEDLTVATRDPIFRKYRIETLAV